MASKIAIDFIAQDLPETGTVVLFSASKKSFGTLLKKLDKQCDGQIGKAMSVSSFDGKENQLIEILSPAKLELSRILILGLGDETASEQTPMDGYWWAYWRLCGKRSTRSGDDHCCRTSAKEHVFSPEMPWPQSCHWLPDAALYL